VQFSSASILIDAVLVILLLPYFSIMANDSLIHVTNLYCSMRVVRTTHVVVSLTTFGYFSTVDPSSFFLSYSLCIPLIFFGSLIYFDFITDFGSPPLRSFHRLGPLFLFRTYS